MKAESGRKILVSSGDKVSQNRQPSSVNKKDKPKAKPISTTEKQSMAYLTVRNIENETGCIEADWPLFILKELTDNAWDWLNDIYPAINRDTKSVRKIGEEKNFFSTKNTFARYAWRVFFNQYLKYVITVTLWFIILRLKNCWVMHHYSLAYSLNPVASNK